MLQLDKNILIVDGGMGSELEARGLDMNKGADLNIEAPLDIKAIHLAYKNADFITTNTFGVNRLKYHGKYNLEDIPAEAIERIEIVRGGGSVLYGSEATGGVVNIITKKNMKNSVKIEAGNYNRQRYAANLSFGKFSAVVNYQHKGKVSDYAASTTKVYDYLKGTQKGILWNYQINDALTFTHNYSKDEHRISARSPKTGKQSGFDLGLTDLLISSDGSKIKPPKFSKNSSSKW